MFADDTNMHCQADSTLSVEKPDYMIIGSRQRLNQILTNPDIVMGDNKINKVSNKTFLEVILDE